MRAVEVRPPGAVPLHPAARPAGARRRRQGPGDPGAPPPTHRAPPPSRTAQAQARRPRPARGAQPGTAPLPLIMLREAPDAAALAPPPRRGRVDLPAPWAGTTAARARPPAADRPPGQGESPVGLPAHQGRAAPPWRAGLGDRNPHHAAPPRAPPRTTASDRHLAGRDCQSQRRLGNPAGAHLLLLLEERGRRVRLLVRDRAAKFRRGSTTCSAGRCRGLVTPVQAPNANAYAEQWVRTVRAECWTGCSSWRAPP